LNLHYIAAISSGVETGRFFLERHNEWNFVEGFIEEYFQPGKPPVTVFSMSIENKTHPK